MNVEPATANFVPNMAIMPVAGRIGAEVRGLDLSGILHSETVATLRQALLRHKVLFVRGQDGLDGDGQIAFARRFGDVVPVPWPDGTALLSEVRGRTDTWHTDMTFADAYPAFGVLRAVVVPAIGGDTIWANTAAAYADLPGELRDFADRLWAVHTNDHRLIARDGRVSAEAEHFFDRLFKGIIYETDHPVVRVHPETGERSLLLGNFLHAIRDFPQAASVPLLDVLQSYVTRPENTVRWRWRAGDVAIWDNRATQHYAVADYGDEPRVLRRVTVAGDVPASTDARRSVMRRRTRDPALV